MLKSTKKISVFAGLAFLILSACNGQSKKETEMNMENEMDKVSYSLGVNIGSNLKKQGWKDLNTEAIAKAIEDMMADKEPLVSLEEAGNALNEYVKKLQEEQFATKKDEGTKFLEENAKKEGVMTLPSGLQYKVLKEGTGEKPALTDKVTTHYHGTKIDGSVFDSSVERGQPATFPVSGVIPGWTEALQLMPVGSKWQLYVPYDLAYGERGAGQAIGPYETLIFDVELLSIEKQ